MSLDLVTLLYLIASVCFITTDDGGLRSRAASHRRNGHGGGSRLPVGHPIDHDHIGWPPSLPFERVD